MINIFFTRLFDNIRIKAKYKKAKKKLQTRAPPKRGLGERRWIK